MAVWVETKRGQQKTNIFLQREHLDWKGIFTEQSTQETNGRPAEDRSFFSQGFTKEATFTKEETGRKGRDTQRAGPAPKNSSWASGGICWLQRFPQRKGEFQPKAGLLSPVHQSWEETSTIIAVGIWPAWERQKSARDTSALLKGQCTKSWALEEWEQREGKLESHKERLGSVVQGRELKKQPLGLLCLVSHHIADAIFLGGSFLFKKHQSGGKQ